MKWFVTAALMEAFQTASVGTSTGDDVSSPVGARGVFISQGAWWDNSKDGMKSFDLWNEKGYGGVDVTVCVAWIAA
jgi:hypothetical protein